MDDSPIIYEVLRCYTIDIGNIIVVNAFKEWVELLKMTLKRHGISLMLILM